MAATPKPPARKTATKPAAAKPAAAKVAAKKAVPVKKAPAAKKAAPAKTAPAKKARRPRRPPAGEGGSAEKAAASRRPPEKAAPAKKAPAAEGRPGQEDGAAAKAAPAKAAPVKKAPAAKAEPVKKAPRKPTTVICPLSGFEVKPEKPGLSPKTLERLEASLREERTRHVQSAADLQAEADQLAAEREGGDTQFDEESGEGDTINIERERDLLLSASAQQIVDEIDRALARIANGTYGVCLPAGRRINLERLEALPYAETCVDCKARAERRR